MKDKEFYSAYYYTFESTGCAEIDEILRQVAIAGKGAHHTEDWNEYGYIARIQDAANKAAESIAKSRPVTTPPFCGLRKLFGGISSVEEGNMPKYDLISEEIKWCEAHRNPEQQVFQDGFISGLQHALFLMRSRPTQDAPDRLPRYQKYDTGHPDPMFIVKESRTNGGG